MVEYKQDNNAKLIVCGCLPQRYKDEIVNLIPEVDRFISIAEYGDIASGVNNDIYIVTKNIDGTPLKTYSTIKVDNISKQVIFN